MDAILAENPRERIGANNPPETMAELKARVDELVEVANKWCVDRPEIKDATTAVKCDDFLGQVTAELRAVEAERVRMKKPHLDAATAVDQAYNPLKQLLETVQKLLLPRRTAWLKREQDRLDKERADREAEARKKADDARKAAEEASEMKGDVVGNQVRAEQAAREAVEATKAVEAVPQKASVKGAYASRSTSLRTTWKAKVTNIGAAFMFYRDRPEVLDVLEKLASADARSGVRKIPGCDVFPEEK